MEEDYSITSDDELSESWLEENREDTSESESIEFPDESISLNKKKRKREEEEETQNKERALSSDEIRTNFARAYLSKLESIHKDDSDSEADIIGSRLLEEAKFSKTGVSTFTPLADQISSLDLDLSFIKFKKGQQRTVTSLCISADNSLLFSGSKDSTVVQWEIPSLKKLHTYAFKDNVEVLKVEEEPLVEETPLSLIEKTKFEIKSNIIEKSQYTGKVGCKGKKKKKWTMGKKNKNKEKGPNVEKKIPICPIYAVAISNDKSILAVGGWDKKINLYNVSDHSFLHSIDDAHRDAVTGLGFRFGTTELYSTSKDRTLKIWDCETFARIDTMYGHELPITGLDLLHQEKCITSGEDGTIRLWKIQESTQLKFISKGHAIDCLCYVSTDKWVSGSQQGILQLWYHTNKKPVFEVINAHGLTNVTANWITAIAAVLYSDLIATGSSNGVVKLWKVTKEREIEHIKDIPILGWINALHFTRDGKYLIVGAGQEPKYAKWERKNGNKNGKNGIYLVPLFRKLDANQIV